jgi:squalene-associated FAD-dependent desaturase
LQNVIVIGGGLAGLSAGVALADAGWRVRLFEQRPFLGGRATSYVLPNGEHVDNCQHVTLGCCTNLDDFYRRVGSADKVKYFDRLVFLDPQGRVGKMQAGVLPAPFHMLGSFAAFAPLAFADKRCIGWAMLDILRTQGHTADLDDPDGISMLKWLRRRKQTAGAIERFWRVVLVSALDEELDRTDARYGVDVFWKAFVSNRTGYRMGIPTVPLAELYVGCKAEVEKRGGEVMLRAPIRKIHMNGGGIDKVEFDGGRMESAEAYVFALPHHALLELLPEEAKEQEPAFENLGRIKVSPITGVHFWFDRKVLQEPFVTLLDTTTQWIFNKTLLYGGKNGSGINEQYLQLVISASYGLLSKSRQEIIDLCLNEVKRVLPAARAANLVKATVIKETAATFSPEPGVDRLRPNQQTRIEKMFLAGDWTRTGWPATMEGAVRSGYLAAEAVLRVAGTPRSFLQADLAPDGLVGWFVKKKPARDQVAGSSQGYVRGSSSLR